MPISDETIPRGTQGSGLLYGSTILVTGIVDTSSLAFEIARQLRHEGARLVCCGLGLTPQHGAITAKSRAYLERTYEDFEATVSAAFGDDVPRIPLDATLPASIAEAAKTLREMGIELDGVVHGIAMDKTIRGGRVKPLLEVTREEFFNAMDVSAYSLIALSRDLLREGRLRRGSAIVALSYLGAARVMSHPYKNIGVAKAALERIAIELADELGRSHAISVNVVRFSPYTASRAGRAIEGLAEAAARTAQESPLSNALPADLADEVAYLLRPWRRVTGEIRHVDGGQHNR